MKYSPKCTMITACEVNMSSYFGLFKMQFKGELQYRAKAFSGILTQFFWGLMYIYLYTSVLSGGKFSGFTIIQLASYLWLNQAFFALRSATIYKRAASDIVSGDVCYKFVRPMDIYSHWYAEYLGEKLSATILRCFPIIVVSLFLPKNIGLSLPVSFVSFLLFLISLVIGLLMAVAISMFALDITFKTQSPKGASALINTIASLFGGMIIPLPLLPKNLLKVVDYLPFRYISDLPLRIYVGHVSALEGLIHIGIGSAWLITIILLGKLILRQSLKKTIIQGG